MTVYHYVKRGHVAKSGLLLSRRFQLVGGIVFAAILPWLARISMSPELAAESLVRISLTSNILAITFGYYLFRCLIVYPGIRATNFIIPAFSVSYVIVILVFMLARLDYNRFLFIAGYISCIAWYYVIFILDKNRPSLRIGIVPFGDVDSVLKISKVDWIRLDAPSVSSAISCDAVVADFRAEMPEDWERCLADAALSGMMVYHVKQLRESLTGKVEINHLSENNFGSLIPALLYVRVKSVFDFVSALAAAVVLIPVVVVFSALIKIDSPGPAMFRQRRVGYGGKPFMVYKFRTMRHEEASASAEERASAITQDGDRRVTRIGRFLRRSRIDELPQFINILRGEMSWIGPRPEAEILSKWYEEELPFYRYRHIVKPGITGWAQVNQGHVAAVYDVHWKLQYDFYYIKNFSLWLDVLIVFRTIRTILTGFGAR